jgi:lipopolysaccharide/colanic/teichoic acid biosynthesis glycosyltransferase
MPTPWGPRGLTGLVQLQRQTNQSADGEQMMLYYAKNQSLLLDLEILLKTVLSHPSTSRRGNGENDPGF